MKIIIIGGVAAGAKAAAKSKRELPDAEVHIYTKDNFVSYSSCGMPYYIAGDFQDWQKLIVRSVEEFEKSGIHIHTRQQVMKILSADKKIAVKDLEEEDWYFVEYDRLVIATGAEAFMPDFVNKNFKNLFKLRTLDDGIAIKSALKDVKHITIIGGGYIAVELIEAFIKNKKHVTLVEKSPFILSMFDEDISSLIQEYVLENSNGLLKIINSDTVTELIGDEYIKDVITSKGYGFDTDMVIISAGVKPVVDLAIEAGITIGPTGAIKVNSRMQTNIPDIYACGDCAEK
ncbi:FAD-dependent oxidoreductase [bacterium]|nr:FAD-dependent oxidoreductase [bacterium]